MRDISDANIGSLRTFICDDPFPGRFAVELQVGSGGMGTVYRARDLHSGQPVALKVLRKLDWASALRFEREAQLLSGLSHPGIVRYLGHGTTDTGEPYLAMEWLDGESLSRRLSRARLTLAETVTLGIAIAEPLGFAHRTDVVHRDLKPGNVVLCGGDLARARIIDFGIARIANACLDVALTRSGDIVGTPGYLAPEQARGERDLDARADVFSFGCILYECITGRAPFSAADALGVLVRLVLEQPRPVQEGRPDVPERLADLVARMLSKTPEERPRDGTAVAEELRELEPLVSPHGQFAPPSSTSTRAITATEQRLACLALARAPAARRTPRAAGDAHFVGVVGAALEAQIGRLGAQLDMLADGTLLISPVSGGPPTDQAACAGRCAIAVLAHLPDAVVVVAAGREVVGAQVRVGDVIDRAIALLEHGRVGCIHVDPVVASLLEGGFDVRRENEAASLYGERAQPLDARTLLGRHTPFVGRQRELSVLSGVFDECITDSVSRVAMVLGDAGVGKSRLRHEFVKLVETRDRRPLVLVGHGRPLAAGSPFGMVAGALRRHIGIWETDSLAGRRARLDAHLSAAMPHDGRRVAPFLGELLGVPYPSSSDADLVAARRDPVLMGDRMREAWTSWLLEASRRQPVLLVLENLDGGDLPSLKLVSSAVRHLDDRPLMTLMLARQDPEVIPQNLGSGPAVTRLHLGRLTPRASEEIVRSVLADAESELVARIVEHAGGNAFYLEELVRAAAEGDATTPATVIAMLEARIQALPREVRRALRAASVFGEVFSRAGVEALVAGRRRGATNVAAALDELAERELVVRRRPEPSDDMPEYVFRHALVRQAAYGMLTDDDRRLGHRLAALWLEKTVVEPGSPASGTIDAMALAEHFDRGGERARAIPFYRRAAEQAFEGDDLAAALARVDKAIACGASGEVRGKLRTLQAKVLTWCDDPTAASEEVALEAMELLPPQSPEWFDALALASRARTRLGRLATVLPLADALVLHEPTEETAAAYAEALATSIGAVLEHDREGLGARMMERVVELEELVGDRDPATRASLLNVRSWNAMFDGDCERCLAHDTSARRYHLDAGDQRRACLDEYYVGYAFQLLGAHAEAEQSFAAVIATAERMGLSSMDASAKHSLGWSVACQGREEEGARLQLEALALFRAQCNRRLETSAYITLTRIALMTGEIATAVRYGEEALTLVDVESASGLYTRMVLAQVRLAQGDAQSALSLASAMEGVLPLAEGEAFAALSYAEVLFENGRHEEARAAIARARDRLVARASRIADPRLRRTFLEGVPENRATLARASAWLGK